MSRFSPLSRAHWKGPTLRVVAALLAFKIVFFGLIYACLTLLPPLYSAENFALNFHRAASPAGWERFFETWDAGHYLSLSQNGYQLGSRSTAFFPFWPALIALFRPFCGGNSTLAALVLANVFSIAALALLHRIVRGASDEALADRTLLLFLAFPGALFLGFPYSEALFLGLSLAIWMMLQRDRQNPRGDGKIGLWIGTLAFLAALTRPTGALWVVPLAHHLWVNQRRGAWPLLLAPLLGLAAYAAIVGLDTGNPWEGFAQQHNFVSQPSFGKIFDIWGFLNGFFRPLEARHNFLSSPYDRAVFLWFLATLPAIWKRDRTLFCYALVMGLVPALTVSMASYLRYALMAWPSIWVSAQFLSAPRRQWLWPSVLLGLFGLQLLFLLRHINFYWTG